MGRRSKVKGKKWERAVARLLRPIFGDRIHRGNQDRTGGAGAGDGADVDGSPWWIECKHRHTVNVWAAFRQAEAEVAAAGDPRAPVVVAKIDKKPPGWQVGLPSSPPVAAMYLPDWIALVQDWVRLKRAAGEPLELPRAE